ncbi:metal-sensing transcriptional repressor [Campylobacter sp. US33a]|uniref:Metal-sensing transcriptional repressor n=1 Tax=Campylobacter sp. CCS1377 TaxID=3158229 RepID=A0AAU7EA96_9BACT|nr:metal-sensing transcriptional repressor [Campylobacter sp. US33a]MCW1361160.1 metal-sensing transcriptional repressor [Campylobacter jejuni]TEY02661.1 hypothetical protein ELQ16_04590 [Campylobacter sp. US33a]
MSVKKSSCEHTHKHSKSYEKNITIRLNKTIGHIESIKKMILSGKDCSEVLIQLAAIKGEINSTAKVILKEHLDHCIIHAIEDKDLKSVEHFNKAIDMFIK